MEQDVVRKDSFTEGSIAKPLVRFAVPVLLAMLLQSLYSAVDLLVVGRFGIAADVSAVATGANLVMMITFLVTGLSMGITVAIGHALGRKDEKRAGDIVGGGLVFFLIVAVIVTILMLAGTVRALELLNTPEEAFAQAVSYVTICSSGFIFISFYNVLGGIFRGLGDSATPLKVVFCAAIINTLGDLLLVGKFDLRAAGAAYATVTAQAISVALCAYLIRKKGFPFPFSRKNIRFNRSVTGQIFRLGWPIALQDGLVGISFLVIAAIVNALGVIPSAGVGVAEKVCSFIMLVPSAFGQSLSAFVAHNIGAGNYDRAKKSMQTGMGISILCGLFLFWLGFFQGHVLTGIFSSDPDVVAAGAEYLKSYAIDCLLTSFLFCYIGYFNGRGETLFVMVQGIVGAFGVRIPAAFIISRLTSSLFLIGLSTPLSSVVQILLCAFWFQRLSKKR